MESASGGWLSNVINAVFADDGEAESKRFRGLGKFVATTWTVLVAVAVFGVAPFCMLGFVYRWAALAAFGQPVTDADWSVGRSFVTGFIVFAYHFGEMKPSSGTATALTYIIVPIYVVWNYRGVRNILRRLLGLDPHTSVINWTLRLVLGFSAGFGALLLIGAVMSAGIRDAAEDVRLYITGRAVTDVPTFLHYPKLENLTVTGEAAKRLPPGVTAAIASSTMLLVDEDATTVTVTVLQKTVSVSKLPVYKLSRSAVLSGV